MARAKFALNFELKDLYRVGEEEVWLDANPGSLGNPQIHKKTCEYYYPHIPSKRKGVALAERTSTASGCQTRSCNQQGMKSIVGLISLFCMLIYDTFCKLMLCQGKGESLTNRLSNLQTKRVGSINKTEGK